MIIALVLAFQAAASPSAAAELVAPGIINTDGDEYGPTLTPDGRLMVFTRRVNRRGEEYLYESRWSGTAWSPSARLPFTQAGDKEPAFSPDGTRLYFAATRDYDGKPAPSGSQGNSDLWVVERTGGGWGEPRPLPAGVNTNVYESYPSAARDALYWAGYRSGGQGRNDLWRAARRGDSWGEPENLARLNSAATEADPFIAPDESYLIFSSDRAGGAGEGDLYVVRRGGSGWSAPVSLGPLVNSADYEYTPWVTADGRWLYFSRGWGEIWRIETRHLAALRN